MKKSSIVKEFKEFISKGSFIDMAVGIVVGGAFTTIVNTMVNAIITPFITWIIYLICGGNTELFKSLDITLIPEVIDETGVTAATVLRFSDLISAILNFFLIALVLFLLLKVINKVRAEAEMVIEKAKQKACDGKEENQENK